MIYQPFDRDIGSAVSQILRETVFGCEPPSLSSSLAFPPERCIQKLLDLLQRAFEAESRKVQQYRQAVSRVVALLGINGGQVLMREMHDITAIFQSVKQQFKIVMSRTAELELSVIEMEEENDQLKRGLTANKKLVEVGRLNQLKLRNTIQQLTAKIKQPASREQYGREVCTGKYSPGSEMSPTLNRDRSNSSLQQEHTSLRIVVDQLNKKIGDLQTSALVVGSCQCKTLLTDKTACRRCVETVIKYLGVNKSVSEQQVTSKASLPNTSIPPVSANDHVLSESLQHKLNQLEALQSKYSRTSPNIRTETVIPEGQQKQATVTTNPFPFVRKGTRMPENIF